MNFSAGRMEMILEPDWHQARPTTDEVRMMCQRIRLTPVKIPTQPFDTLLARLRESHRNGGAHLVAFEVGPDVVFDWFASRNRLWDERLLGHLLVHPAIRQVLPELLIPSSLEECNDKMFDPFLLDGTLAHVLYHGGAYWRPHGDGRDDKALALEVCDAIFGLCFGEIVCNVIHGFLDAVV